MKYELYLVGGYIRDEILGIPSKDVDYSVVYGDETLGMSIDDVFEMFVGTIKAEGYEVFLETPDCFTVRAKFPEDHELSGVVDFVLARKETYTEDSRTPICTVGTLRDDLERRDFTINAFARPAAGGEIIDYFDGLWDLGAGVLDTPLDPVKTFTDDPLRILRGIRFAVTKNMHLSHRVLDSIRMIGIKGLHKVSDERIRAELNKAFKFDSLATYKWLMYLEKDLNYPILEYLFDNTDLWLELTNKKR